MTNEEIIEKLRLCNKYVKVKEHGVSANSFYIIKGEWLWYFYSTQIVSTEILGIEKEKDRSDRFISLLINGQYLMHTKADKRWKDAIKDIEIGDLITSEDHLTPEDFNYLKTVQELLFELKEIKNYKPTNQIVRLFISSLSYKFSIEVRTKGGQDEVLVTSEKEKDSFSVGRLKAFNYLWPILKNKEVVNYTTFKNKMNKNKKKD